MSYIKKTKFSYIENNENIYGKTCMIQASCTGYNSRSHMYVNFTFYMCSPLKLVELSLRLGLN